MSEIPVFQTKLNGVKYYSYLTGPVVVFLQPLKVIDPDHPLAALVRKAQQERNGMAVVENKPEEVTEPAAPTTQAHYTAEREYPAVYVWVFILTLIWSGLV